MNKGQARGEAQTRGGARPEAPLRSPARKVQGSPCKHHAAFNAPKAFQQTFARSSSVQSGGLDALGRRVREADPDSRSASERGVSAKREKHREQGRRHLAVNS